MYADMPARFQSRRALAGIKCPMEIRWCPAQAIEGNAVADEWAKLAADEPNRQGWSSCITYAIITSLPGSSQEADR